MSDLKYFTDDALNSKLAEMIFHGFFTRTGGVSRKGYRGLNCGFGSNDDPRYVTMNRDLVSKEIGVKPENLLSLYQVHGNECLVVDHVFDLDQRPQGDAFVTDRVGIGLGILTADCAPVLFYGRKPDGSAVIGAAHAGWKGVLSGVLENTVSCMIDQKQVQRETITAVVGPCLLKKNFEVQTDFVTKFIEESYESEMFFSTDNRNRLVFDLSGYCAYRLSRVQVRNATLIDIDTYPDDTLFYSYRRATHKGEEDYGRQISVISIRN